ncbi:hypothetical protein [Mycolicibacterium arseniciresistens]|uniref:Uncharacterized protein n=1 Tax=Mycolicibacterium arseniciresistens TaxID=3062257 RepID=A0ABT8U9J3_9MYCO|nr:hypothetical protein [Mycolicibacterium arseniciresistens]MDO3634463.1 hypothetical protein [Mycolicibacterium arseniciresistens]
MSTTVQMMTWRIASSLIHVVSDSTSINFRLVEVDDHAVCVPLRRGAVVVADSDVYSETST